MADNKVYVLDDGANKYEAMTREQITAAILQAVNEGTISDIDAGFITKILEKNKQKVMSFWVGTQAEFHALESKDPDTLYLFSDDPLISDINNAINNEEKSRIQADEDLEGLIDNLDADIDKIVDGTTEVKKSTETKIVDILNNNSLEGFSSWVTTDASGSKFPTGVNINIPSSLIPSDGSYVYLNVTYDVELNSSDYSMSIHLNLPISVSSYKGNTAVQFVNSPEITKDTFISLIKTASQIYAASTTLEITNPKISGDFLHFVITPTAFKIDALNGDLRLHISSSSLQNPRVTMFKKRN